MGAFCFFSTLFSAHVYTWAGTQIVTINNATDIISTKSGKDCVQQIDNTVVDSSKCPQYPNNGIILWYKIILEKKVFADARKYCDERGWRLFGEYNGTQEQVDWLLKDFVDRDFYLGITKQAGKLNWVSDKGEDMTNLINNLLSAFDQSVPGITTQERRIALRQNEEHKHHYIRNVIGATRRRNFICVIAD